MCFEKQIDLTLKMAKFANFYAEEVLKQEGGLTAHFVSGIFYMV